jgi:hypothetical protein
MFFKGSKTNTKFHYSVLRHKAFSLYWGLNAFALETNLYEVVEQS